MTDKRTLDLARDWAEHAKTLDQASVWPTALAAADLIASLPDSWVDADKLREVINSELSGYKHGTVGHHVAEELTCKLEPLFPDPEPRTMAEIEWDDEEHHLAEATAAWSEGHSDNVVMLNKSGKKITVYQSASHYSGVRGLNPGILTPTGRKYRLEPEGEPDDVSTATGGELTTQDVVDECRTVRKERSAEPASPRPEDVPVGEPWQVEVGGETAIGFRNDPREPWPWCVTYQAHSRTGWLDDEDVTLIARLVPETTEQDDEPDFDPAYTYRDKDGDEWQHILGAWRWLDTAGDINGNYDTPPAWFGPYTRIEKEDDHDQ